MFDIFIQLLVEIVIQKLNIKALGAGFEPAWACAQRLSRPPPFLARLSQRNINIYGVLLNLL